MTEEEVKARLINKALQKAGWNLAQIGMERSVSAKEVFAKTKVEFSDGQILFDKNTIKRGAKKRCDYVLFAFEEFPLAIIEAKDDSHSLHDGLQQAMNYAKLFGCHFAYSSNGSGFVEYDFFTGRQRELSLDEFPSKQELLDRFNKGSGDKEATKALKDKAEKENNVFLSPRESIPKELRHIIMQPFYLEKNTPRYYQAAAVNKTLEAIASGQRRILLVMATGTGKTFTAFEIIWRLYKAGKIKKILYLADRNNLIDQTMQNDFKPLAKEATKIENRRIDSAHPLCFGLYNQFVSFENGEIIKNFEGYAQDAFDFILVDECHRSSAKEDSAWRPILEYFKSAIQVGMTATPRNKSNGSNLEYFENLVYEYGLNDGISDGYLAPYKVKKYTISKDTIYKTQEETLDNKVDITKDYVRERIELVAKEISDFLKYGIQDRFAKTIVFCEDQNHANYMAEALRNENSDLMKENSEYIVRITADEGEIGKAYLESFIDIKKTYPTIVTTSKLLTTGADTKMVKVIAIDSNIDSITEFTQIIGRGTRINEKAGKRYFTILDFTDATRHFNDPYFSKIPPLSDDIFPQQKPSKDKTTTIRLIDGVEVEVVEILEQIRGANGELIATDFKEYSQDNLKRHYSNLEDFITSWNATDRKGEMLEILESKGILINELKTREEYKDKDEFDIILSLAFNQTPLSRAQRAKKANKFLAKYEGKAREVLEILLEKYAQNGILDIENPKVFETKPFDVVNTPAYLDEVFGGVQNYINIMKEIKKELYQIA